MHAFRPASQGARRPLAILIIIVLGLVVGLTALRTAPATAARVDSALFLPVVQSSARNAPVPALVSSFALPDAACPHDIAINPLSNNVYITYEVSHLVGVVNGLDFVGNVYTGKWPIYVESDQHSRRTYVTNVLGDITVLDRGVVEAQVPAYHEAYFITINPINGYTYITDLHGPITIMRDTEKITDLSVPPFEGKASEWQLTSAYDPYTGLMYFASWQFGYLTVVDGTTVVRQFAYYGEGAKDMVIDADRRFIYLANFRAGEDGGPANNISVVNMDTGGTLQVYTGKHSRHIALDPASGYVYATNPEDDTVTVLLGRQVVATYAVGKRPWHVTVNPRTGHAFVTNSGEHSVTVFKDGAPLTTIELPAQQGYQPWVTAVHPINNTVYVVDRSSRIVYDDLERPKLRCEQPWIHILK